PIPPAPVSRRGFSYLSSTSVSRMARIERITVEPDVGAVATLRNHARGDRRTLLAKRNHSCMVVMPVGNNTDFRTGADAPCGTVSAQGPVTELPLTRSCLI